MANSPTIPAITHVAVTVTNLAASEAWYTMVLGVDPGLDHIAFGCESRGELEKWSARLDELGITHGEIVDAHYGSGLSFRDPDNIALELFAPPA